MFSSIFAKYPCDILLLGAFPEGPVDYLGNSLPWSHHVIAILDTDLGSLNRSHSIKSHKMTECIYIVNKLPETFYENCICEHETVQML